MTATLKRRRGWVSGRSVAVDRQHPIAQGLAGLAVSRFVVTPQPSTTLAAAGLVSSPYGPAWSAGVGQGQAMCAFPAQDDTTCFTLLAVAKMITADNYGTFVGNRTSGAPLNFIKVCGNVSSGAALFAYFSNGTDRSLLDPVGTGSGKWDVVAATKSGLTLTLYRGGQQVATTTYTSGQLTTPARTCLYGPDTSGDIANQVAMGAFWDTRALSVAELAELAVDPFAVVTEQPRRRRVIV